MGLFTLLLGVLRFGFLDSLISRPILHGFITASALIIAIEQRMLQTIDLDLERQTIVTDPIPI